MILSHMLRTREFLGEFEAGRLVVWLQTNEFPKGKEKVTAKDRRPQFRRIHELITLVQKWSAIAVASRPGEIELMRRINRLLRRYEYRPQIGESFFDMRWTELKPTQVNPSEAQAILYILKLSELGLLDHVRPCEWCTSWHFAKFRHQKYCKKSCQQKAYAVSPEWREHRRKYMRKYRG